MTKQRGVYKTLPDDYFHGLYEKVAGKLVLGQNILVSTYYGGGAKTFLAHFVYRARKQKLFDHIYFLDPEVEATDLAEFVKAKRAEQGGKMLIVTRFFASTQSLPTLLEKLNRLRQPNPERLVYLATTDHSAITDPEKYFALTNVFFAKRYQILPFDLGQTQAMMRVLNSYYSWKVPLKLAAEIQRLSGGIPMLIKAICACLYEDNVPLSNQAELLQEPHIMFQLKYTNELIFKYDNAQLRKLGLIDSRGMIVSELLSSYFAEYISDYVRKNFSDLTGKEEKVLTYLYENMGKVVTIDKISDLIQMSSDDFSLWAIYKLISRLKKKVEPKLVIDNVKNKGYVLKQKES